MFRNARHVFVYNQTKQSVLGLQVRVADSVLSRLIGLLGKRSLEPNSGVWIFPANGIHTIGMMFTFDAVLMDKNFKVVGLRELIRPYSVVWPGSRVESVIELPAYTISRSHTEVGDQLQIERYDASQAGKDPTSTGPAVEVR